MIKFVIGFDEIAEKNTEYQDIKNFLEYQFPEWDIENVFKLKEIETDDINQEYHIPFIPIK